MEESEIAAIQERAEKATKGPWGTCPNNGYDVYDCAGDGDMVCFSPHDDKPHEQSRNDSDFIAHSREDVPNLCRALLAEKAENERLRAEVTQLARESTQRTLKLAELEREVLAAKAVHGENERLCKALHKQMDDIGLMKSWIRGRTADTGAMWQILCAMETDARAALEAKEARK